MSERCQCTRYVEETRLQCLLPWGHVGAHQALEWANKAFPCGHLQSCAVKRGAFIQCGRCQALPAAPAPGEHVESGDDPMLDFQPWDDEEESRP